MRGLAAALAAALALPVPARAFRQPALNYGATTISDGGPVPPGLYLVEYIQYADARSPRDSDGTPIPGGARVTALANLNQIFWLSERKILGAHPGVDLVLPLVALSGSGALGAAPLSANRGGPGDLVFGPALQWNGGSLLGRPLHSRVELLATLPTGVYDPAYAVNPGARHWTLEPYYAFTWAFAEAWTTSARLLYAVHGENPRLAAKPGRLFHLNYEVSRAVIPRLRLGAAGYFLRQLTDDRVAGARVADSKERAFAAGPALAYAGAGALFVLSHLENVFARNRFRTSRTTLQLVCKF